MSVVSQEPEAVDTAENSTLNSTLRLYELPWSHFVEKVRLGLALKGLAYERVAVDPFRRTELRPLKVRGDAVFPTLQHGERVVVESSPILRYLDQAFPDAPLLFPGAEAEKRALYQQLIELDSCLGLAARRLAYVQVMLECPGVLTDLFLGAHSKWAQRPWRRWWSGHMLGLLLTKRFAVHRCESVGLYESTLAYLRPWALRLQRQAYASGSQMTAVDCALVAYLRLLAIIPFFAEHPDLAPLWAYQQRLLSLWQASAPFPYQEAIAQARQRRPAVQRHAQSWAPAVPAYSVGAMQTQALNDQQPLWTWPLLLYPWHYWVGLRRNKFRAR